MRDAILTRFESNIARARSLTAVYVATARPGQGRQSVETLDLLRAAVVFLHASLEEVFRNIVAWKYPSAGEAVLNAVPLVGGKTNPEKFLLGKLSNHRDKSVQELINESIAAYLDHFTVNNTTEISAVLVNIGIPVADVERYFPSLTELLERRHHIVHQADRNDQPGPGQHGARGINYGTVTGWIDSVEAFIRTLLARIPD